MEDVWVDINESFYSAIKINDVLVLSFHEKPLLYMLDQHIKQDLLDVLDTANRCSDIKAILLKESPCKMVAQEYISFYKKMNNSGYEQVPLERMYNAINQLILKLVDLNKVVIHADSGNVIHLFMNIGFACDYRIVANNTVFQNPNIDLGIVLKGTGAYFLTRMIGTTAASKFLFSQNELTAVEGHRLGIVDEVVPLQDLDRAACDAATRSARTPNLYAVGIKKLIHQDSDNLQQHLELETKLLRNQIQSYRSNSLSESTL